MKITPDLLAQLPIQIAERVSQIEGETNDRVLIWTSLEISEATLRWVFATTVAALQKRDGEISNALLRQVSEGIQRPTLGQWIEMNKALSSALINPPQGDVFGADFAEFFLSLCDHPKHGDLWEVIHQIRNNLVHGGGLTATQASKQWEQMSAYLSDILKALAQCHEKYGVFARLDGQIYDLKGVEQKILQDDLPVTSEAQKDDTWLTHLGTDEVSSLRPLLTYEPIDEVWEIDQFRSAEDALHKPVPQSYFKLVKDKLYYIPIGVDDFVSIGGDVDTFRALFPEPVSKTPHTIQDQLFLTARRQHVSGFVGRVLELQRLEKWLSNNLPSGDVLGLVIGGPGLGKSAFIAKAALNGIERNISLNRYDYRTVFHSFNAENPANDRRYFLHNLRQQLQAFLKKSIAKSKDILDVEPAETSVRDLLKQSLDGPDSSHITIFVDGLDEIRALDRDFPAFLVELLRPGLTIVASTRNEEFVSDFDAALKVGIIKFGDEQIELPGMTKLEVRAMLLQNLGERGREILSLDADIDGGTTVRNPYIEKVVRHAGGKPLYIELLVSDLFSSESPRIDPNVRLPASMSEYYGKLLTRQGVSDTKAHLAILLCLLSLAEEPLQEVVLADLLALAPSTVGASDHAMRWVSDALRQGEVFFSSLPLADGKNAITVYHQELEGYLKTTTQLKWAQGMAKWLMATAAANPDNALYDATRSHMQRFGALYLLEHSQAVRPLPIIGDVQSFVSDNFLKLSTLRKSLTAWNGDSEGFLRTYARIDRNYREIGEVDPTDRLSEFLRLSIEKSELGLGPNVVHSILGYGGANRSLYSNLLSAAVSERFLGAIELSVLSDVTIADWFALSVGDDRRTGQLDRADDRYDMAMQRLDQVDPDNQSAHANRVRGKLEYEKAYCAYFRGEEERAFEIFGLSAHASRRANDSTGVHIALSVQQNTSIRFARAYGRLNSEKLSAYRVFCIEQLTVLQEAVAENTSERERLDAERWVMNCKAHLCGIAYLMDNKNETVEWYNLLLDDAWVKKQGNKQRLTILRRIEPRVASVQGRFDEAAKLYRKLLPTLTSDIDPNARLEGVAEYYLEFADLLMRQGEEEEARGVIQSGLLTNDTFANAMWKPSLMNLVAGKD